MPYIGNSHITGDHTNNFKVLDDLTSHTATFDGSSSSVIDTTSNTIRVVEHRFIQGQRVTYTNGGGGNIGGLTTGTAYFIIFDTASTFKLATSASNAANSVAINLSAAGTGSSHTLNAAFDGVNTKFKITYNGGTGARFNNATQLNIAINNVLQKPNVNSSTFTEGFAIEDNHKIVFKVAPSSEDIFWGSIIANTLTTFDISDHKIDTFTGDGSTTEFTLSHTPANNESLMVTINGVLQHPSNASTARAYTLIASIIQFTAAPGVGDEIQVRHMGFAGATTADVSGFYGRTGNVVLTSNDHITTGNINAGIVTATSFDGTFSSSVGGSNANFTGIITAGTFKGGNIDAVDGSFSGNVTIGGTLTYEDVTNIDSVGILTARSDVHVGAGVSAVGVGTFSGLNIGGNIIATGTISSNDITITDDRPSIFLVDNGENPDYEIRNHDGDFRIRNTTASTNKIVINSDGHIDLNGNVDVSAGIDVTGHITGTGDLDVDGHTNLDNVSIAGVATITNTYGYLYLEGLAPSVFFKDTSSGTPTFRLMGESGSLFVQNTTAGGNSLIINTATKQATFEGSVDVDGDLDVDGHTNLDNVSIAGVTTITQDLDVDGHTELDNVRISGITTVTGDIRKPYGTYHPMLTIRNAAAGSAALRIDNWSNNTNEKRINISYNFNRLSSAFAADDSSIGCASIAFEDGQIRFGTSAAGTNNSQTRFYINSSGHFIPNADSTFDIGTNSVRVRNFYADTLYGDGSNLTGITQTTINNNGNNRVITGSGTANTLEAEDGFLYNGADEVSINHVSTNENSYLSIVANANRRKTLQFKNGSTIQGCIGLGDSDEGTSTSLFLSAKNDPGGASPHMTIDSSGDLGLNTAPNNVGSQRTLHIKGPSGEGAAIRLQDDGDTADSDDFTIYKNYVGAYLRSNGSDPIIAYHSGGEKLRIATDGSLLIGGIRTSNTGFGNKVLISGGTLGLDGNGSNIGMHFHRNSGDTEGYIGIGPWAVTGGGDDDFGIASKGDLLFGTSTSSWAQKMRVAQNGRVKIGQGEPKAQLDIKQVGNSWEDALLIQHDNANTGWNIHAERTNSALWFGYNSNTGAALADQSASQVLHLNSNRTTSLVTSNNSYELTIGGISGGPTLWLRDSGTTGTPRLLFGSTAGALIGAISYNNPNDYMSFYTNGTEHIRIDSSGHFKPVSDATRDLGTSSTRWRNVYTTDLQLSNENTGGNEVDGTEGNWTLQEGESDIYMINRKTGKKYKMMLQEVD